MWEQIHQRTFDELAWHGTPCYLLILINQRAAFGDDHPDWPRSFTLYVSAKVWRIINVHGYYVSPDEQDCAATGLIGSAEEWAAICANPDPFVLQQLL